jgi:hypothetical protein
MKALVTGYPGTGKSSVARELQKRGHIAYDTEAMHGYMHLQSVTSGKKIALPSPVPRGWFDTTGNYNWDIPRVSALLNAHEDVYICALADNQEILYDVFDCIFLLLLDEVELEKRLFLRTTTNYGKDAGELADILMLHRPFEQSLLNRGAISIDVSKAVPDVVDEILNYRTKHDR